MFHSLLKSPSGERRETTGTGKLCRYSLFLHPDKMFYETKCGFVVSEVIMKCNVIKTQCNYWLRCLELARGKEHCVKTVSAP